LLLVLALEGSFFGPLVNDELVRAAGGSRVRRHRSGRGQRAATFGAAGLGRHATLPTLRADLLGIHLTPSRLVTRQLSISYPAAPGFDPPPHASQYLRASAVKCCANSRSQSSPAIFSTKQVAAALPRSSSRHAMHSETLRRRLGSSCWVHPNM